VAFSFNAGGNGRSRRRSRGDIGALSEINVTPFVDVVLVLLIMFMLTAHVMEFGIEVDVPKVSSVKDSAQELPVINITKDARLYLNDKPVNIHELVPLVEQRFGKGRGVYLRADKETPWDNVAQVMDELRFAKTPIPINVVTQPEDAADKGRK
jgi:biopolymer transport protein ExbD/biopolymer transport protein TolR